MNKFTLTASAVTLAALGSAALGGAYAEVQNVDWGSFTAIPPAGVAELSAVTGFGGRYDRFGRVLANANVTDKSRAIGTTNTLDQIRGSLWSAGDADLYKFTIVDPATFSASITGTTQILALFDANGVALGATRGGGTANALTDAALAATLTPGDYYIGVATGGTPLGVPRNNANQALFDFTTNGVKDPVAGLSDYALSTDPFIAWTIAGTPPVLLPGTSNFTQGTNSWINLTGSAFAIPEPGTLGALVAGALLMTRRR